MKKKIKREIEKTASTLKRKGGTNGEHGDEMEDI